jgi:hypothetical protein
VAHSESGLSSVRIPSAVSEGTRNGPVFPELLLQPTAQRLSVVAAAGALSLRGTSGPSTLKTWLLGPYFVEQMTFPMDASAWVQDVVPTGHRLAAHAHDNVCEPQGLVTQVAVALRVPVVE